MATPCIRRHENNKMGASIPIDEYEGKIPIIKVGTVVNSADKRRASFLPNLSPIKPKAIPPIGRAKYPVAKARRLADIEERYSFVGKKVGARITAKNPYNVLLYDSKIIPEIAAMAFLFIY
jgi:hypothetical protein